MASERGGAGRTFGYVVAALVNVLILFVVNAHEVWRPWLGGVVTARFADALWALNLNGAVQIAGNLLLAVFRPRSLRRVVEVVFAVAGLVGAAVMFAVFPFDLSRFSHWVTVVARGLLILGIAGASIGLLVSLFGGGRRSAPRRTAT